jgi:hypothetical protein
LLGLVRYIYNPVLVRLRQEEKAFKASLGSIVSSRPYWVKQWNPVSKKKKKKTYFSKKQLEKNEVKFSLTWYEIRKNTY